MKKKVGIRFKTGGKIYDFSCGAFVLNVGDKVIVESEKGLGLGTVETPPELVKETNKPGKPLKSVFRKANEKDLIQVEQNMALEREAHAFCMKSLKSLGLKMNLFSVESTFDASRLTFFFTADARVDFRQLVRILVNRFKVRIEMRQVGIRNQAKMCGGLGRCGRAFCCSSFMEKFEPVSIRMAKQQGLSLNPTKISGQCGRLMCCLTFENETYRKLKQGFPKIGKVVTTKSGRGKVTRHNVICNRLTVRLEEGGDVEINLDDVVIDRR
jgi:cell fate regulator YaaT (PSP1 superfamily)